LKGGREQFYRSHTQTIQTNERRRSEVAATAPQAIRLFRSRPWSGNEILSILSNQKV
jgi:hypothetical protein